MNEVLKAAYILFKLSRSKQRRKYKSCGMCTACNLPNCKNCINCRDRLEFGGSGSRRQKCLLRRCWNEV